jgi:hypothetical protein
MFRDLRESSCILHKHIVVLLPDRLVPIHEHQFDLFGHCNFGIVL